jgi:hypothetical protein
MIRYRATVLIWGRGTKGRGYHIESVPFLILQMARLYCDESMNINIHMNIEVTTNRDMSIFYGPRHRHGYGHGHWLGTDIGMDTGMDRDQDTDMGTDMGTYLALDTDMDTDTSTQTHGHRHMDTDTWTRTHGHRHMDTDTWTQTHGHRHEHRLGHTVDRGPVRTSTWTLSWNIGTIGLHMRYRRKKRKPRLHSSAKHT